MSTINHYYFKKQHFKKLVQIYLEQALKKTGMTEQTIASLGKLQGTSICIKICLYLKF